MGTQLNILMQLHSLFGFRQFEGFENKMYSLEQNSQKGFDMFSLLIETLEASSHVNTSTTITQHSAPINGSLQTISQRVPDVESFGFWTLSLWLCLLCWKIN